MIFIDPRHFLLSVINIEAKWRAYEDGNLLRAFFAAC